MDNLAKRAVACKHWRWMPGMLAIRWTGPCRGSHRYTDADVRAGVTFYRGTPDLEDPATLGCLLALVREAWGDSFLSPHEDWCHKALWSIKGRKPSHPDWLALPCHSEAEALVAALEAAP